MIKVIEDKTRKILQMVTELYLVLILGIMPLYMPNKYVMLGSSKFIFFRDVSIAIGLCIFLALSILLFINKGIKIKLSGLSHMDKAILIYGLVNIMSFMVCDNKAESFWGFPGWYMGLFSQVTMICVYFVTSRLYSGERYVWRFIALGGICVFFLGVLNRLDIDPFNVYASAGEINWMRTHYISTIGNNNWYAGYISVIAGIFLVMATSENKVSKIIGSIGTILYYGTVMTQGSITGFVAMIAIVLLFCACEVYNSPHKRINVYFIVWLLPVTNILLRLYAKSGITGLVLEDELGLRLFFSSAWFFMFGICTVAIIIGILRAKNKKAFIHVHVVNRKKIIAVGIALSFIVFVWGIINICNWSDGQIESGRVIAWKLSLQCYKEQNVIHKLIGFGPDNFYHVMYNVTDYGNEIVTDGIWDEAVFANAHNEWINMLICNGFIGLVSYLSIFGIGVYNCLKGISKPHYIMILLSITGYFICAGMTFQHVLFTPFLFCLLGMSENKNI